MKKLKEYHAAILVSGFTIIAAIGLPYIVLLYSMYIEFVFNISCAK